jgi:hypothetical protein
MALESRSARVYNQQQFWKIKMNVEKSKIELCAYALLTFTLMLAGCRAQHQYDELEQVCSPQIDMAEVMQAAEDVLADLHFTIDKADTDIGLIRTRPLPGAQLFEFWRDDNVGAFNITEANLHTIRRVAQLSFSQQGEQLCINCDVRTYRLSLPEHEVTSSARAYRIFSRCTPSMQKLELNPEQQKNMAWIDLGRDEQLATKILKRIENTLNAKMKQNTKHASRDTRYEL